MKKKGIVGIACFLWLDPECSCKLGYDLSNESEVINMLEEAFETKLLCKQECTV